MLEIIVALGGKGSFVSIAAWGGGGGVKEGEQRHNIDNFGER